MLKYYDENVFLTQKELADFCHTSISMITNFSKKLNYSGYRELLLRLKMEREYYVFQKRKIHNGLFGDRIKYWQIINEQNRIIQVGHVLGLVNPNDPNLFKNYIKLIIIC